jgi:hypothetical protein
MGQLIIKTKDEDCLLELGDVETNFGKQVAALIIEVPRKELSKYYSTFIYDQTSTYIIVFIPRQNLIYSNLLRCRRTDDFPWIWR